MSQNFPKSYAALICFIRNEKQSYRRMASVEDDAEVEKFGYLGDGEGR
jgi:hypothetical protein